MKILFKDGTTREFDSLVEADLVGANLQRANLKEADLKGANLERANLAGANLSEVNLRGAYLVGANLVGANLRGAYLVGANLVGATLRGANLGGANLVGATLINTELISFTCGRHFAFIHAGSAYPDGNICKIGCRSESLAWWVSNYKAVGTSEGYSEWEIKAYGAFITYMKKELT